MICYRDRTWCAEKSCKGRCGFPYFTEQDQAAADKWWGKEGAPIAVIVHEGVDK